MLKYTFTFKKGDVNLEYVTTDKESMERQFQIWVTCASVWAYNQDKIEKGLMPAPMPKAEKPVVKQEPEQEIVTEIKTETNGQPPTTEVEEQTVEAELIISPEQDEIERESARIIQEYKAEMEAEARKKETDAKKEEFKQDVEKIIEKEEEVQKELSELYEKPETINDIQEHQQPETHSDEENADFDVFLQKSMSKTINDVKEKRDDRFLKVVKVKNTTEKIDFLIVTAYYLSEFERLDRFTLKLVNAKLMENMHEVVDNSVLQDAINQGLVECLPNYTNIPSAMEYRLTEAGEEAFLNGRKNG
ncbi:hypothetical protein IJ843_03870 [bacterium]|nr:hypothetical protein [bacterium]